MLATFNSNSDFHHLSTCTTVNLVHISIISGGLRKSLHFFSPYHALLRGGGGDNSLHTDCIRPPHTETLMASYAFIIKLIKFKTPVDLVCLSLHPQPPFHSILPSPVAAATPAFCVWLSVFAHSFFSLPGKWFLGPYL